MRHGRHLRHGQVMWVHFDAKAARRYGLRPGLNRTYWHEDRQAWSPDWPKDLKEQPHAA